MSKLMSKTQDVDLGSKSRRNRLREAGKQTFRQRLRNVRKLAEFTPNVINAERLFMAGLAYGACGS